MAQLNPETLKAMKEAAAKATREPLVLIRYDHGGGRMYAEIDDPDNDLRPQRELIADFYDEANREFYALCEPAVTALKSYGGLNRLRRRARSERR